MPRKEIHTVPNLKGGWDNKKPNAQRASGHYDTKAKAIEAARVQAQREKAEHIPHKMDGTIQKTPNSYGHDPRSIKG